MADDHEETVQGQVHDNEAPDMDVAPPENGEPVSNGGMESERYQELNNQYLRLAADFENFRRRQAQEREHLLKYGAQNTLETLLTVLDNLDRAQRSLSESSDPKMLYKSFEMLSQQLLESLKSIGLTRMHPVGEIFDPERHEAVSQIEKADAPDHSISEVYQDGYMLHDRILRPAKVVVSVTPEGSGEAADPLFEPVPSNKGSNPFQKPSKTPPQS
jgi:molecular chaperone GrpE